MFGAIGSDVALSKTSVKEWLSVSCSWGALLAEMQAQLRAWRSNVFTLANHGEDVGIGLRDGSDIAAANE